MRSAVSHIPPSREQWAQICTPVAFPSFWGPVGGTQTCTPSLNGQTRFNPADVRPIRGVQLCTRSVATNSRCKSAHPLLVRDVRASETVRRSSASRAASSAAAWGQRDFTRQSSRLALRALKSGSTRVRRPAASMARASPAGEPSTSTWSRVTATTGASTLPGCFRRSGPIRDRFATSATH
jgi:hypothetical protein